MKIPFGHPEIGNSDLIAVLKVLEGPDISIGYDVAQFEKEFAKYTGTGYAVAVNSGTTALELAIRSTAKKHGVTKGKIITPSFTFIATANAIVTAGFEPVFVDIDPLTYNISVESTALVLAEQADIVGILPVHLFGYPARTNELLCLAEENI
jgi:Predicted pyridoxal phosphate-dependent enzyme apparently involved in regulation of cell wall biogenesis